MGADAHPPELSRLLPAVLAQLKRRKIMVPALLRMAYTVGFETLSAQVRIWTRCS